MIEPLPTQQLESHQMSCLWGGDLEHIWISFAQTWLPKCKTSSSPRKSHDGQNKERTFNVNDSVFLRNYHQGPDWLPGEVLTTDSRNYKVKLSNSTIVQHHVD